MNKILLSFCAAAMSIVAYAGTTPGLEYQWGKIIDGKTSAGDQSTDVSVDKNGNIYWFGTYGTTTALPDITFGGDYLYTGSEYEGTSNNGNFTLIKTDANGNKLWFAYSNSGDFANNAGGCAATSDGGVVVVSKVRHTDGMTDKNLNLVDATGKELSIDWTCERRFYRLMVTKFTAEGAIAWNRFVEFSTEPGPGAAGNYAQFWADVFNCTSMDVDSNDNIYIALNYRNKVTVKKADGTDAVFTPAESASWTTWTGDSQSTVGDFMVLGLDANGYYRNSLTLEGTAKCTYCQRVEVDGDKVYAQGYTMGDGTALKVGDFTFTPTSDGAYNPLLISADADLKVKWVKNYIGEKIGGKHGFQNCGITPVGNTLWFCGQYNLKITDPDDASKYVTATQGSLREGFVIKLDATDGSWIAARNSRDDEWNEPSAQTKTGLTGYFKVLQNVENPAKIYVYGYNMSVGAFLRQYDATTLEANLEEGQNNVVTSAAMVTCQCIAYDPKNGAAYLTTRANKAMVPMGGESLDASTWAILVAKFNLPSDMKSSGIDDVVTEDEADAPVEYYNLQGMRVENPANGIYIRRQGSKATKVVL